MKHITCLCAGTLLACLALSNAYASTPRHFLPYTADVSVPAHSAGSENPLVADRDDHREQMRQQRQLEGCTAPRIATNKGKCARNRNA